LGTIAGEGRLTLARRFGLGESNERGGAGKVGEILTIRDADYIILPESDFEVENFRSRRWV